MLLQKIKTRGFIGHRGAADSHDGAPDFVELDFTDTSLSLVHGVNGAGKSTFWDALLFSFFKEHRASGREAGKNLECLIHDRAEKAEITVEFMLNEGQTYEIYSQINRKKSGGTSVTRRICLVNGKNRQTKCETEDSVKEWVKNNLQMSVGTFTSSVLLRQGEADRFLKAKPAPRKEILLELLQLGFYRELGARATKRKNKCKEKSEELSDELAGLLNPTKADVESQRNSIAQRKTEIEELEKQKDAKNIELNNARRAAELLEEISEIEKKQQAAAVLFARAVEIRQKYDHFCELEKILERLENFWSAKNEVERKKAALESNTKEIKKLDAVSKSVDNEIGEKLFLAGKILDEFQAEIQERKNVTIGLEKEAVGLKKSLEEMRNKERELNEDLNACRSDYRSLREKIERRNEVTGRPECPQCGSQLDEYEAARIAGEIEKAQSETKALEVRGNMLKAEHEKINLPKAQKEYEAAEEKAQRAKTVFQIATAALDSASAEWEEIFKSHAERVENESEIPGDSIERKLKNLSRDVRAVKEKQTEIKAALRAEERTTETLETELTKAKNTLKEKTNKISSEWRNHAACEDKSVFNDLCEERNSLASAELENESLTEANNRKNELETELRVYREELDKKIPVEHRRPVSEINSEITQIIDDIEEANKNLRSSDDALREILTQQKTYQKKKRECDAANKDFRLWRKLSEAFGKKGLEARIVQSAQETVKQNANRILGALCDTFQVKLEESASGEELEIYVHDSKTQNADEKGRHFEYFSGGESLLIAISLAVAIGQAVAGRNVANTLIIDEGFGALDDARRELLVSELRRLSDEVLKSGRVIVVSHQENVKERFDHRYFLEKDDKGFVKVSVGGSN